MDRAASGWMNGLIGVTIFAGSLPATRVAVMDFDPMFLTCARATLAALPALAFLLALRQPRPDVKEACSLAIVAAGVVVGFPLLTALALQRISSAHSLVFTGLLPLCTALFGTLRGGERPGALFWLFSVLGSLCVTGYAFRESPESSFEGSLLMLAAVLVCGLGYAEGARLTRNLGGWQVISWALVLALPVLLPAALLTRPESFASTSPEAWLGLGYVSLFSMLIGFVFWYRGLAIGGIAVVGQLQLLQPFLGFALAALLLGEHVSWAMLVAALGAVLCVACARRFSISNK